MLLGLPHLFDALEWLIVLAPIPWLVAAERRPRRWFRWGWLGVLPHCGGAGRSYNNRVSTWQSFLRLCGRALLGGRGKTPFAARERL